ncbi:hypothetical protein [Crateriforma conspicua]|uniref:Uncharacterized protein n=1 Tax=Crateriforma conspicua TaxID=2527996 RepID=A0A5C6FVD5_9PLAN|nr:hypothetical protein [Crateriforma conspicua]TWU65328.1 hypothetical protein V7x_08750 [Crateriforma conspicua]
MSREDVAGNLGGIAATPAEFDAIAEPTLVRRRWGIRGDLPENFAWSAISIQAVRPWPSMVGDGAICLPSLRQP